MTNFAEQVAAALDTTSPDEASDRVHQVVADELARLDPSAEPELTGYFNHSYVPDLIVKWQDGTERRERPVYLRHSLQSSRASGDFEALARMNKAALFMSLSLDEPDDETGRARAVVEEHADARTLITTVPAVDELAKPAGEPDDPVLNVIRASVVRSAKGFIQESDVERFMLPRSERTGGATPQAFNEAVRTAFTEEAAYRIERVATIVEQALTEDLDPATLLGSGQLTEPELRELIPYLLQLEGVTQNPEFWASVANLVSLEVIERHWSDFTDLDLTRLASAASSVWTATRAQLALRSEAIDDETYDATPRWRVSGKALTAEVGSWRIAFAHTGTKLKATGRELAAARWDDLEPALADYTVTGADLSGVITQSKYGAVEGVDMKDRIDSFIDGADDSFHVLGVTVAGDDHSTVKADFRERLLTASPQATIATLTRTAVEVLGYQNPPTAAEVEQLLDGPTQGSAETT